MWGVATSPGALLALASCCYLLSPPTPTAFLLSPSIHSTFRLPAVAIRDKDFGPRWLLAVDGGIRCSLEKKQVTNRCETRRTKGLSLSRLDAAGGIRNPPPEVRHDGILDGVD